MGGRGSGGGRSGGGAAKKVPTGEGITDKNELVNLYNSISGNSNLSVEQRVKAMHDIQEKIKEFCCEVTLNDLLQGNIKK